MKTGLFKWSKDYASAAINYDEAVQIYDMCQEHEKCLQLLTKLVDINKNIGDEHAMGKNYEFMINIYKKKKFYDMKIYENLIEKAAQNFMISDSINTFVTMVQKVAEYFDDANKLEESIHV